MIMVFIVAVRPQSILLVVVWMSRNTLIRSDLLNMRTDLLIRRRGDGRVRGTFGGRHIGKSGGCASGVVDPSTAWLFTPDIQLSMESWWRVRNTRSENEKPVPSLSALGGMQEHEVGYA